MKLQIAALIDLGDDYIDARVADADLFAIYQQAPDGTWQWIEEHPHLAAAEKACWAKGDLFPELRSLDEDPHPREFWPKHETWRMW